MLSYTIILVIALAMSSVSPALSAPLLQVREQSLSHRGPIIGAPPTKRAAWGKLLKKIAIELGIGTASTVAGYDLLDHITGPSASSSQQPAAAAAAPAPQAASYPPAPATSGPAPAPATSVVTVPANTVVTVPATSSPGPAIGVLGPGPGVGPATSGPGPGPATSSTTPPTSSNNGNYQSNTANPNTGTQYTDPGSGSGSSIFARSVSNKNRRATSALELLSRTDLEETLKLFKRILDELD